MEEHRSIIKEVFGESSDSEDDDQQIQLDDPNAEFHSQLIFGKSPSWEPVCQINGLSLCRDLLSHDQQSSLLSAIENEGWFTEASHNQAMRFGDLPRWATELAKLIREVVHLVNKFLSEVGYALLKFYVLLVESDGGIIEKESERDPPMPKIPVYLTPGSVVLMWGEARYHWKHEINRNPGFQKWEGKDIDQKRRTSITLRKLCPDK
ncbi:hypothetical protein C3L33_07606, partial [Rhododendron williamsianum]